MAYHNRSVSPHDVALCAAGPARYEERGGAVRLLEGLFEAAPISACAYPSVLRIRSGTGRIRMAYPVACLPRCGAAQRGRGAQAMQALRGIVRLGEDQQVMDPGDSCDKLSQKVGLGCTPRPCAMSQTLRAEKPWTPGKPERRWAVMRSTTAWLQPCAC